MRAERLLSRAAVISLFALVVTFCLTRLTDTDVWWHLAAGDWIRRNGAVPVGEPFSYTVPGLRWVDIHWLFEVVLSFLYERGGTRALDLFRLVMVTALSAILFARGRKLAGTNATVAILLVATIACQERFLIRPEIVSFIMVAVTLPLLERALEPRIETKRRRLILWVALPLIQVIWVNVQGLFMLGPVFCFLALLSTLPGLRQDGGLDRSIDFLGGLACEAIAGLANPYGAQALRLPFQLLFSHLGGESLLSRTIAEFQPTLSAQPRTAAIVAFAALAACAAFVLFANASRLKPFDLLIVVATGFLALRARRNIPLFAIAAVPVLLRNAGGAWDAVRRGRLAARSAAAWPAGWRRPVVSRPAASACLAAVALFLVQDVASNRFYLRTPTERWFGVGAIPFYFPEEAARAVDEMNLPGQIFHPLAAGGFLIHAWHGDRGVFIDGRNDPYLDGVLESYLKAISDPASFEELVRRYQITAVLWPHERALEAKPLLAHLARAPGWTLIHLDPGAAIFMRGDVLTPAYLAGAPPGPGRERDDLYEALQRSLDRDPFKGPPIREIALGEFFNVTGDPRGAERFYGRALERTARPDAAPVYNQALAIERQGRRGDALAAYRRALAIDPGYMPAVAALGSLLVEEGRLPEAEANLDRAYRAGQRGPSLMIARARLFDRLGRPRDAVTAYQEALRAAPGSVVLLRDVGGFYMRHDQPEAALAFFTEASGIDPDDPGAAREMAQALVDLGRRVSALDVARDAARRVGDRLAAGGRAGEEDRQVVLLAARLEMRAGNAARAGEWLALLRRAGDLRPDEIDPELRPLLR